MNTPVVAERTTPRRIVPLKILVAGGFGVGKTTLVTSISEIVPLTTEAAMTSLAAGVDDRGEVTTKTTTTVAMDFGRITVSDQLVLYLFGTPGQDRFGFMWDELVRGALGAIVLVDSRRITDSFPALDYFEHRAIPFVVALNCFDGQLHHDLDDVRDALGLATEIPIVAIDARNRVHVKHLLIAALELSRREALKRRTALAAAAAPTYGQG